MSKNRTVFLLMAQYEKPLVELSKVAGDYLGISAKVAAERASARSLPFPTQRLAASQKSPWLVHVDDLAEYIESRRGVAKREWERSQV